MAKPSSIKQLDPRVRAAVDAAIREDRASINDIVAVIKAMGAEASRSAVGRYVQNAKTQMQKYREAQEVARVWIGKMKDDPESDMGRLVAEMLRTVAFQQIANDEDAASSPMEIMLLSKSLEHLAKSESVSLARQLKIREIVKAEAALQVQAVGKELGLSESAVDVIKRRILGMNQGPAQPKAADGKQKTSKQKARA
ncbi:MAG TPA: phage protein Gp27 family protein [Usitatibacteraceae bacterium]